MKLIGLQIENVQNLKAIEISFAQSGAIEITGPNGAGKSSVLNSLAMLLEGKDAIPMQPIRKGETSAKIRGVINGDSKGELIVTRTFALKDDGEYDGDYTTKLTVQSPDGAQFPSPQALLASIISARSFDPMVFDKLSPKDQLEALKKFVVGFDFKEHETARQEMFDRRTSLNRQAKEAQARADGVGVAAGAPTDKRDEAALVQRLADLATTNAEIERLKAARNKRVTSIEESRRGATLKREQAAALIEEADKMEAHATQMEANNAAQPAIGEPVSVSEVQAQIDEARRHNAIVDKAILSRKFSEEAQKFAAAANDLTSKLEQMDEVKRAAISGAKFPVDGLGIAENGVLLNGVPYQQANSAERIRATFALAMADNPKLRVARISDASRLTKESFALVCDMAEWNDYLVIMETVSQLGTVAVHISEGQQVS